jgi:hypothetical protein
MQPTRGQVSRLAISAVLILTNLGALPALAAHDTYVAFDFRKCMRWVIDNEPGQFSEDPILVTRYAKARKLAEQQALFAEKLSEPAGWESLSADQRARVVHIFTARSTDRDGRQAFHFGVCHGNPRVGLSCLPGQDFPLAGARYNPAQSMGDLVSLKCVSGCGGVPSQIHDMGYEAHDMSNREHEAAMEKFRKQCLVSTR